MSSGACTQCCTVYTLTCSLLLLVFAGVVKGSVSFDVIGVKQQWKMEEKTRAALLASLYYFVLAVGLAVHGFVWPKLCRKTDIPRIRSGEEAALLSGADFSIN